MSILTADVRAGSELGRHERVHGDHDLLLLGHQCVAFFDLLVDPFFKVISDDGSADVYDPLLRHLRQIRLIRKVEEDLWLGAGVLHHTFQRQILILGDVDVLRSIIRYVPVSYTHLTLPTIYSV